jgi:hypothetical protein
MQVRHMGDALFLTDWHSGIPIEVDFRKNRYCFTPSDIAADLMEFRDRRTLATVATETGQDYALTPQTEDSTASGSMTQAGDAEVNGVVESIPD